MLLFVVSHPKAKPHDMYACNMLFKGIALFQLFSTTVKGKLKKFCPFFPILIWFDLFIFILKAIRWLEALLTRSLCPWATDGHKSPMVMWELPKLPSQRLNLEKRCLLCFTFMEMAGRETLTHLPFGNFLGDACIIVAPDGYERSW